jgi:hypothetical protein
LGSHRRLAIVGLLSQLSIYPFTAGNRLRNRACAACCISCMASDNTTNVPALYVPHL